jgi:two-component system, LuxR family, sensor kinase FixL
VVPGKRISDVNTLLVVLLVFIGYYVGALFGFALTFRPVPVSTLWPPNSFLMAALLLMPLRSWWVVLAAAFPAHLAVEFQSGVPTSMVLLWFVSNSTEALLGAAFIRRYLNAPLRFDLVRHVAAFLVLGAFLAPFLSSFLDAAFVRLIDWGKAGYWQVWRTRLLSNMLAVVILVPVVVSWCTVRLESLRDTSRRRYIEAALLMSGLIGVSLVLFMDRSLAFNVTPILLYTLTPFLIWAAVRFGPIGVSTALMFVTVLALWKTVHYHGPFVTSSPAESALSIQLFLIVVSVPLLFLAAALGQEKNTKRALSLNEERLRLAMSAAQIGAWEWHIASNRVTWSDISKRIFGAGDVGGDASFETFTSNIYAQDRPAVLRAIDRTIADKSDFEESFRVVWPNGETRWIRSRGQIFYDTAGRAVRMIGVNLDFTVQRAIEFELAQQREQLTYLNRVATLGELSGALAHELNQPLAAILANAEAGRHLTEREPLDIQELREIYDDIAADTTRAGEIIRRLYALFKNDAPEFQPLDVNQLVRDVLVLARTDFLIRNIDASIDLTPHVLGVLGDRVQLQQVLLNMILNACEAMADNRAEERKLCICTQNIDAHSVRISVADHGSGVTVDGSEKLFEAFYTTKQQGLGLGLSICRSIVLAHGGRLWATNNQNGGATFSVDLPGAK